MNAIKAKIIDSRTLKLDKPLENFDYDEVYIQVIEERSPDDIMDYITNNLAELQNSKISIAKIEEAEKQWSRKKLGLMQY